MASARAIFALVLREISTAYGRTPGGYLWAILEPAAAIGMLAVIFSLGFRNPPIGHDFAIFYASGMLPFLAFLNVSNAVAASINFSKALLVYPSVTYVDAILARFMLNMLTQVLVAFILLTGILIMFDTRSTLDLRGIILSYLLTGGLALGIGTLNCALVSLLPIWQRVWAVVTRPLFVLSGIIFLHEAVPQPYQDILAYNPLVHIISIMRTSLYAGYDAPWASPLFVIGISLTCLAIGQMLLYRYHKDIIHN